MNSSTFDQDPSAKSSTLKFIATSIMSPSAKIVVYFVRNDGELVADSVTIKVNGAFENDVGIAKPRDPLDSLTLFIPKLICRIG